MGYIDSCLIFYLFSVCIIVESCLMYIYLHKKTNISLRYLYKDNVVVIALVVLLAYHLRLFVPMQIIVLISLFSVPVFGFLLTIIRFFRFPLRRTNMQKDGIVSPADGNIIYIKKIDRGEIPMAVKNGVSASLNEFANTDILDTPCIIIGINMTPFDVHRNCAPCDGTIILNKHFDGKFLSLKDSKAFNVNERNSIVIETVDKKKIGVVQTASKLVRRIVTYKKVGDVVARGEWFGMIKFGSQVDVILPANVKINVSLKQQVYCKKTILASWND